MGDNIGIRISVTIKEEFREKMESLASINFGYSQCGVDITEMVGDKNAKILYSTEDLRGYDGFICPTLESPYLKDIRNNSLLYEPITGLLSFQCACDAINEVLVLPRYIKYFLGPIVDWNDKSFIGTISEFWYTRITEGVEGTNSFGMDTGICGRSVEDGDFTEWVYNHKTGVLSTVENQTNPNSRNEIIEI